MKGLGTAVFFLIGVVAVVLSMEISSFTSSSTTTTSTTTGKLNMTSIFGRPVRDTHKDDDSDEDDEKNDKDEKIKDHHSTSKTTKGNTEEEKNTNSERGSSRALRLLRQHTTSSDQSSVSSTRRSRERRQDDESTEVPRKEIRQTRPGRQGTRAVAPVDPAAPFPDEASADVGAPGAPGEPQASEGRQAAPAPARRPLPGPAPRPPPPPPPPPSSGVPATLTLPDGADVIVNPIVGGFTCDQRIYGYYADTFNDCKLFHVCVPVSDEQGVTNPIQWSFICGNQTLFNQELLVCDHAINVDCSKSESFYNINENFGKIGSPGAVKKREPQQLYFTNKNSH